MPLSHEAYMARCIHLAKLGQGKVTPNPMVGSVIVYNNKIIGEGYHQNYGKAHAEVNAINTVSDQSLLNKATIYVNLEPCAHFGKTPPCANLIIEKGLKKVVIGCIDPFSEVAGKGVKKLEEAGIEVVLNILQKESEQLNKRFFKFHSKKRPYIILKWAESLNGMIDIDRDNDSVGIHWITQPETKSLVHKWRAEEAGILVGRKTIENDNPSLTCRNFAGLNPKRFIIDRKAKLDLKEYRISEDNASTYILTDHKSKSTKEIHHLVIQPFTIDNILSKLHELNIQSLIIEGGKYTLQQFIDSENWDEARILTGVNPIKKGSLAPQISGVLSEKFNFGKDTISIYQR